MTGVEPVSYYLKNGILNFNIVFILALLSPLAVEVQVYLYIIIIVYSYIRFIIMHKYSNRVDVILVHYAYVL